MARTSPNRISIGRLVIGSGVLVSLWDVSLIVTCCEPGTPVSMLLVIAESLTSSGEFLAACGSSPSRERVGCGVNSDDQYLLGGLTFL